MSNTENDSRYRAAQLGALLARHYPDAAPHMIARVVFDMQQAAKKAVRFAGLQANGPLTEDGFHRYEAQQDKREAAINAALAAATLFTSDAPYELLTPRADPPTVELGGDPRGPCARLHIPGQGGDGMGEGFAIY